MRDRGEHRSALLKRRDARHILTVAGHVPVAAKLAFPRVPMVNDFRRHPCGVSFFDIWATLPKLEPSG